MCLFSCLWTHEADIGMVQSAANILTSVQLFFYQLVISHGRRYGVSSFSIAFYVSDQLVSPLLVIRT